MLLQSQSLSTHFITPSLTLSKPSLMTQLAPLKSRPFRALRCSLSTASQATHVELPATKPFPAEVSRTIMELSSEGTLSTLNSDGWPLGIGVQFAVGPDGTPVLCLNESNRQLSIDKRSTLHVQLKQYGLRTPQCTIQGSLAKPGDAVSLQRLLSAWTKRFGLEAEEDQLYYIDVERVLQIEDFKEVSLVVGSPHFQDGIWVTSSDYRSAIPDPLRDCAEKIITEINTNNLEDVHRFCNVYVDLNFQVSEAKVLWVDRLGFDFRIFSPPSGIFDVRIPFPTEVADEKGAKSSFNCMSQLAWEVEKNFHVPDFKKVQQFKQVA